MDYGQLVIQLKQITKSKLPETEYELRELLGAKNIERLADKCPDKESKQFLLENAEIARNTRQNKLIPAILPWLRNDSDFHLYQYVIIAKQINGMLVKDFSTTIKRIRHGDNGETIIVYKLKDNSDPDKTAEVSLKSWQIMSAADFRYCVTFWDFSEIFTSESKNTKCFVKPGSKNVPLNDPTSLESIKPNITRPHELGAYFVDGLRDVEGRCNFVNTVINFIEDNLVLLALEAPYYAGGDTKVNMTYPSKRILTIDDMRVLLEDSEIFTTWIQSFTHKASLESIAHDQSKALDSIPELIDANVKKYVDYCYKIEEALQNSYSRLCKLISKGHPR